MDGFVRRGGSVPSPWAAHGWVVFLNAVEHIRRAIRYVEENPRKAGLPRQQVVVCCGVSAVKCFNRSGERG